MLPSIASFCIWWLGVLLGLLVLSGLVVAMDAAACWIKRRELEKVEAWKSYALALEVELECLVEYHEAVEHEGCGTRAKRKATIAKQRANAMDASFDALKTLRGLNEYDS